MVEGLCGQSVRPLRGLTGEARSRPGVTVAGGPTVQSDLGQQLHPSRARHLHHDGRVMETAFLLGRGRGAWDLGGPSPPLPPPPPHTHTPGAISLKGG